MKIRNNTPPYRDVDPDDVVVTRLARVPPLGGLEAYGYLRSEMRIEEDIVVAPISNGYKPGVMVPGAEYRVAYVDDDGWWQAEGTVRRESPPAQVLAQIEVLYLAAQREAPAR